MKQDNEGTNVTNFTSWATDAKKLKYLYHQAVHSLYTIPQPICTEHLSIQ